MKEKEKEGMREGLRREGGSKGYNTLPPADLNRRFATPDALATTRSRLSEACFLAVPESPTKSVIVT